MKKWIIQQKQKQASSEKESGAEQDLTDPFSSLAQQIIEKAKLLLSFAPAFRYCFNHQFINSRFMANLLHRPVCDTPIAEAPTVSISLRRSIGRLLHEAGNTTRPTDDEDKGQVNHPEAFPKQGM